MTAKCDKFPSKRNSDVLGKGSGISHDLRKRTKGVLLCQSDEGSPTEEKNIAIKEIEVAESASQSTSCRSSHLEFTPQSQDELRKIYRQRPRRPRRRAAREDLEESEEEEPLSVEELRQTEGYKLLLNDFAIIAEKWKKH